MSEQRITLVLLPGLNGTAGLFDPLCAVATDEYELLIVDYPTGEQKCYEELVVYVLEKLNSIKGAYVVVGESFSGPIAVFLAARNLPGLLGIILVATFIQPPYFSFFKYLPWTFIFTVARPLYKSIIALSPSAKGNILRAASVELLKVKPWVLAARVNAALTVDATGSLEETKIPVAYLRARYDLVVPPWNLKKIIAIKPATKVIRFNCQHFLLQSAPHAAWQTISNLCRKFADYHRSSN